MYAGKSTHRCVCPLFAKCRADEAANATWLEMCSIIPPIHAIEILKMTACGKNYTEQILCPHKTKLMYKQINDKEEAQWRSLGTKFWNKKSFQL